MSRKRSLISVSGSIVTILLLLNGIILQQAYVNNSDWYWALLINLPLILLLKKISNHATSKRTYYPEKKKL